MSNPELNKAKIELYRQLLLQPHKDLSESEVDIMYLLSQDRDIQKKIQNNRETRNENCTN